MALAPRLDIRQSQQLVMTPQLQQAIKLLQLSNLDLTAFVEQELEKNPLLERADADLKLDAPAETVRDDMDEFGAETPQNDGLSDLILTEGAASSDSAQTALDTDYDNLYNNDATPDIPESSSPADYLNSSAGSLGNSTGSGGASDYSFEDNLTEDISLQDHLTAQLQLLNLPLVQKFIAVYLIDLISDTGYFSHTPDEISQTLNCEVELVIQVLHTLRELEPAGVFATGLADCLALQLKEKNRLDPAMQTFLDNLDLLAKRDMKTLMSRCAIDSEDLTDMISEIRDLDPKPGLQFGSAAAATVIPDVFISQNPDGSWNIELNSETLPKVLVNNRYYTQISSRTKKKQEREFISECLNTANWLVKSLDQRANTILKVARELVRQQEMFFTHGIAYLRPMNLKVIADAIEMHESTVSRVTSNKYMATPNGIFELKYFFTSAINSTGGAESHAAESVKHRLKQLVENEKPTAILSDDKIVILMKKEGIDIARRTVAKYRDALKIPSSVQRRRQKKLLTV